jgi:hypothetical protein
LEDCAEWHDVAQAAAPTFRNKSVKANELIQAFAFPWHARCQIVGTGKNGKSIRCQGPSHSASGCNGWREDYFCDLGFNFAQFIVEYDKIDNMPQGPLTRRDKP